MILKFCDEYEFMIFPQWKTALRASFVLLMSFVHAIAAEPEPPPEPVVENVSVLEAVSSQAYRPASNQPFGVGKITIPLKSNVEWTWHRDQPACVKSDPGIINYQAFQYEGSGDTESSDATFTAWFLIPETEADHLVVSVAAGGMLLLESHSVEILPSDSEHSQQCLEQFWLAFNDNRSLTPSPELQKVNEYLRSMLARRMNLAPFAKTISIESTSSLERQFERSVGMLFGFTSVRLAMMELGALPRNAYLQEALRPLPPAMEIRSQRINSSATRAPDPLSLRVPKECFYFRFPTVKHYLWVRQLIQDWGGSLNEVVAVPAVDAQVRSRIERQLVFDPLKAVERNIDDEITDAALIGLDTYFHDGAAVGILFQARPEGGLAAILEEQREATSKAGGVRSETFNIGVHPVHFLATEDNQIRSFYLQKDQYHLVTNSRRLATLFTEVGQTGNSLGSLREYRYALSYLDEKNQYAGILYMSDPFFRNITSPEYRVEVERRRHAAQEIQSLKLAFAAARAESNPAENVEQLIAGGFLPEYFGLRPDKTKPKISSSGKVTDSLRGAAGTFLPVSDVEISAVTSAEYEAYVDFSRAYLREWRTVDPVLMTMTTANNEAGKTEKVIVDVRITPFARAEYETLARHLPSTTTDKQLRPAKDELLGLSLPLKGYDSPYLRFGLLDANVEWEMKNGEIVRRGEFQNQSFAERNSYVLLTPFNRHVVDSARSLSQSLQNRDPGPTPNTSPQSKRNISSKGISDNYSLLTRSVLTLVTGNPAHLFTSDGISNKHPVEWIGEREKYVRSKSPDVAKAVNLSFGYDYGIRKSHVLMQMNGVQESNVFPYLEAVTWAESRRLSAADAAVVNRLGVDWRLSAEDARTIIEDAVESKMNCPTGGEYQLVENNFSNQSQYWVSSLWQKPSLYQEASVPEQYNFSFLNWLRSFTLDATLDVRKNTLSSHLELDLFDLPEMPAFPVDTTGRNEPKVAPRAEHKGTLLVNGLSRPLHYRCRKIGGVWSEWRTIPAHRAHRYRLDYSLELEYNVRQIKRRVVVDVDDRVEISDQTEKFRLVR